MTIRLAFAFAIAAIAIPMGSNAAPAGAPVVVLDVPGADVPKGSHRLVLEIRDGARNVGRREFELEVGE